LELVIWKFQAYSTKPFLRKSSVATRGAMYRDNGVPGLKLGVG